MAASHPWQVSNWISVFIVAPRYVVSSSSVTRSLGPGRLVRMTQMHQTHWVNGTDFVRDARLGMLGLVGGRFLKIRGADLYAKRTEHRKAPSTRASDKA